MRKYSTSTIVGTVSNLFKRAVPTRDGGQTQAIDMTVALHSLVNGRSVPAYIQVTAIGKQVEFLLENDRLKEDVNVLVGGELKQERWVKDDKKMSRLVIKASRLEIVDATLARTTPDSKDRTHVTQGLNCTTIAGNLTAAPELRKTPSGDSVANFTVALNHKYTGGDGQEVEETTFMEVVAWRSLAEDAFKSLKKGSAVTVNGALVTAGWTDKDGNKRQSLQLEAMHIFGIEVPDAPVTQEAQPDITEADLPPVEAVDTEDLPF